MRLVVALLAALALAAPALAASRPSEADLETKLVCPVCHETLDESNAPVAQQMKAEIRRRIAEGWTEKQILDEMVANYGPGVLSTPATHGFDLLAWVLPLGGIAVGALALGAGAWYWSRNVGGGPPEPPPPPLAPEDAKRVEAELARFDA
ncbi:MAG TPA: cytochrome c-type biogenesis protein CcmH [Gaiellaceae bacterium]